MINSVKDLYPAIKERYDLLELPGQGYSFPGQDVLLRSNSPELIDLLNEVYHGFRSGGIEVAGSGLPRKETFGMQAETPPTVCHGFKSGEPAGTDPITLYLLKESDQFLTVDPGFDSFTCSVPDQVLSFWGAQLMCNHLYRSHLLFLHGSVLARDGRAYIFLGDSNTGKSTTTLKLREEGFGFFSDEFAPIDLTSGLIHPFPRSFLLRSDGTRLTPELSAGLADLPFFNDYQELDRETGKPVRRFIVIPELLYTEIGKIPLPVGGIFFLDKFGSEETALRPLTAALALEKLLDHSVNNRYLSIENRDRAISAITTILKNSPAFILHSGPLNEDPGAMAETINRAVDNARSIETGDLDLILERCRELLS
jgi:hypothetical protein